MKAEKPGDLETAQIISSPLCASRFYIQRHAISFCLRHLQEKIARTGGRQVIKIGIAAASKRQAIIGLWWLL